MNAFVLRMMTMVNFYEEHVGLFRVSKNETSANAGF